MLPTSSKENKELRRIWFRNSEKTFDGIFHTERSHKFTEYKPTFLQTSVINKKHYASQTWYKHTLALVELDKKVA